jgi:hypothetical protein
MWAARYFMVSRRVRWLLAVVIPGILSTAEAQIQPSEAVVRESAFIFQGTVTQLRASRLPEVPPSEKTIVVTIGEVVLTPALYGNLSGKEVTVEIQGSAPQLDTQAIFFGRGWQAGKELAIVELLRLPPGNINEIRVRVNEISQKLMNDRIRERIATSVVVIVGQVTAIAPRTDPLKPPFSAHDPTWAATVAVSRVLKSTLPQQPAIVLFSQDGSRFVPGQEGIWFLHTERRGTGYIAADPLDFQPMDQLKRIESLILNLGPER